MGVISRLLIGEGLGEPFTDLTFYPGVAIGALHRRLRCRLGAALVGALRASAVDPAARSPEGVDGMSRSGDHDLYRPDGVDMIRWHVSDNGPGLADDVRELLFEPMTSTKANGMGNGLSISKSIIEANCGRIRAESDTGATFSFALPLTAAEIEE